MNPKIASFLSLIAWSEGTSTHPLTKDDGYDVIVTGVDGKEVFTDYSTHPFANRPAKLIKAGVTPKLFSSASGRYQIIHGTWLSAVRHIGTADFGHDTQDAIAVLLIGPSAIRSVMSGDIESAIAKCRSIWASFPGVSAGGQVGRSMQSLIEKYESFIEVKV